MAPNIVNWFDIPVIDLDRAIQFYSKVIGSKLERYSAPGIDGATFPKGGVTGTLLKSEGFVPSSEGSVVYLNGGDDLSQMLARAEVAGGKVLLPKTEIAGGRGYFAYVQDCEGNRIGLNSPN